MQSQFRRPIQRLSDSGVQCGANSGVKCRTSPIQPSNAKPTPASNAGPPQFSRTMQSLPNSGVQRRANSGVKCRTSPIQASSAEPTQASNAKPPMPPQVTNYPVHRCPKDHQHDSHEPGSGVEAAEGLAQGKVLYFSSVPILHLPPLVNSFPGKLSTTSCISSPIIAGTFT